MIRLWIKGTVEQARLAASQRGIELQNPEATPRGTVAASATDEHLVRVIHWYCEDTQPIPGEGHPAGTLLLHC